MRDPVSLSIASAATGGVAAVSSRVKADPVVLSFLGLPFELPSMIAAMFGVVVTRVIIGQADKATTWRVKLPVDVLCVGVTFFVVVEKRPELFAALGTGIFIGTLGATIIRIAERWGAKLIAVVLPDGVAPTPPAPPPPGA